MPADDPYLVPKSPADQLRAIGEQQGISPDVTEDYLKVTKVESGTNPGVRKSNKGAVGLGQLTPDQPGGRYKTVGGKQYDIYDPTENMTAGLRYFDEGGSDPVARRLGYFTGQNSRTMREYKRTGRIANVSDSNMTAAQYVRATGGKLQQAQQDPYLVPKQQPAQAADPYLVPNAEQPSTPAAPPTQPRRVPRPRDLQAQMYAPLQEIDRLMGQQGIGPQAQRSKFAVNPNAQIGRSGPRRTITAPTAPTVREYQLGAPVNTVEAPGGSVATQPGQPGIPRITPKVSAPTMSSVMSDVQSEYQSPEQQQRQRLRSAVHDQVAQERSSLLGRVIHQNPIQAAYETAWQVPEAASVEAETDRRMAQIDEDTKEAQRLLTDQSGHYRQDVVDKYDRLVNQVKSNPDSWWHGIDVGSVEAGASVFRTLAGIIRLTGTQGDKAVSDEFMRRALTAERAMQTLRDDVPMSTKQEAAAFVTRTVGDLAQLELLSVPAGPTAGFAAHGGLQAIGQNKPLSTVVAKTGEGAAMGLGFKVAPILNPVGGTKVGNFLREAGVIAGATAGIGVAAGETPEQIGESALANIGFHGVGKVASALGRRAPKAPTEQPPTVPEETQAKLDNAAITDVPTPPETVTEILRGMVQPEQPHISTKKNRRVRNTKHGGAGEFKEGYKPETFEHVEYEGYKYTKKPNGRWFGGPSGRMVTDTNKIQELEFNLTGERPEPAKPAESQLPDQGFDNVPITEADKAEIERDLEPENQRTAYNLLTGKPVTIKGKKGGGFIDVREIHDAIQEIRDRLPQLSEDEAREYLEQQRPYLFSPGVSRAEEAELMLADKKAQQAADYAANPNSIAREYVRTQKAIMADYPEWTASQADKWIAKNRPELARQMSGDFGVQGEHYLRGRKPPSPTEAAEKYAREQVADQERFYEDLTPEERAAANKQVSKQAVERATGITDLTDRDIDVGPRSRSPITYTIEQHPDGKYRVELSRTIEGEEHKGYSPGFKTLEKANEWVRNYRKARAQESQAQREARGYLRASIDPQGGYRVVRELGRGMSEIVKTGFKSWAEADDFAEKTGKPRTPKNRKGERGALNLEVIKQLQEDLAKLHEHTARTKGLMVAPSSSVRNYFDKLFDVVADWAPEHTNLVHDAYAFYDQGNTGKAVASSEAALSAVHRRYSQETVAAQQQGVKASELRSLKNENWKTIMDEVRRRVEGAVKSFHEDEQGALKVFNPKKYPKKGRPDTERIGHVIEPVIEKLWADASKRISENKLRTADLKTYVSTQFSDHILPELEKQGWHIVNRGAALAVAAKRLSQIAGEKPGEQKPVGGPPYEQRRAEWQKQVDLWKSYNDMTDDQIHKLAATKYPESYRTDPLKAIDRLYQSVMPKAKAKRADTWQEEVMNRLNATETALDKEKARMASAEPTAAQQAAALKPPPPAAQSPEGEPAGKVRKLWESLAEKGREPGTEREYEPEKLADWRTQANKLVDDYGTEAAQEFYDRARPDNPVRVIVGRILGDRYQMEAVANNDPELLRRSVQFANERVLQATQLGRAVKAHDDYSQSFTPSGALDTALRLYRRAVGEPDAVPPSDLVKEVTKKAQRVQAAQKAVTDLEAKVESEPEQPKISARKPRLIKRILGGGGEIGAVKLPQELKEDPALIAARKRKLEAEKAFKTMQKEVGEYWTKASHPDLEKARIELRDAKYDLIKTFTALQQRAGGNYYKRALGITRAAMVSQWTTAIRNAQTQVVRYGVERATDAAELGLRTIGNAASNLFRSSVGLDSDLTARNIWKNTGRLFKRSWNFSEQILKEHPEEYNRMYTIYAGDVRVPMPSDLAVGMDKAFGKVERGLYWANTANRIQEFHIRSAEFLAELDLHIQKDTGMSLEQFVATRGADKLPEPLIKRAIDKALDVTFANKPAGDTRSGQILQSAIDVANYLPPTMSPVAFARFMFNNLKFLYQYNPIGGAIDMARLTARNRGIDRRIASIKANDLLTSEQKTARIDEANERRANIPRAVGRWMLGTSMFLLAYQMRRKMGGEKWYELQVGDKRVDMRPFGPFSTYLFMGEIARRWADGEKPFTWKEWVQALGASTAPGGISMATAERMYNAYQQGDYSKISTMLKSEGGDWGRALLTPIRQFKDIIAAFNEQEAITRDTKGSPLLGPMQESIPFASRNLPPAYQPTSGQPVRQTHPAFKQITGYRFETPKSYAQSELDRLHFQPSEIRGQYTGVPKLDNLINQRMGEYLDEISSEYQADPRYQKANDKTKTMLWRGELKAARKTAIAAAADEMPKEFEQYKISKLPAWKREALKELETPQ